MANRNRGRVEITARLKNARKFQADAYQSAHAVDEIGDAANRADRKIIGLNARVSLFRNAVGLVKPAALVTGLGLAAQGAVALGAGVIALTSGLAPLGGLMVAYPALGLAAAQGFGAWAFATNGVMDAVGGLNGELNAKKLGSLTPEAQRLALAMADMKKPILGLQRATQAGMFPGVERSLKLIRPLLGDLRGEMGMTGLSVGHVVEGFAKFAKGAGTDIQTIMRRNATYIFRMGTAGTLLTSAFRHVLIAAGPLLGWLTKAAVKWATYLDHSAKAGRESGKLASFFWKTRTVATQLFHILGNVGGALFGIGRASSDLGGDMLDGIEKSSAAWNRWSKSATGQRDMRRYFTEMKPTIWELSRLVRDVVKGLTSFGNAPGLAALIAQVRTQLLPVLLRVASTTTASFGPTLVNAATKFVDLFAAMSGGIGPLTLLVDGLGYLAQALTFILQTVPGAKELSVVLVTLGMGARLLKFGAMLTGLRSLAAGFMLAKNATNAWSLSIIRASVAASFGAILRGLVTGFWALNAAMVANPIGAVVLGIAALGAGLVIAYRKSAAFRGVVDGIANALKSVVGWLGKMAKAFLDSPLGKIAGFAAKVSPLGMAGSVAKKIIPGLATGGVVRAPGATLVGENGPELLSMERGARVDPLPRLAQGMATEVPAIGGVLSDAGERVTEVTIPVHLDGKVIYEAVGRVARDRASRR